MVGPPPLRSWDCLRCRTRIDWLYNWHGFQSSAKNLGRPHAGGPPPFFLAYGGTSGTLGRPAMPDVWRAPSFQAEPGQSSSRKPRTLYDKIWDDHLMGFSPWNLSYLRRAGTWCMRSPRHRLSKACASTSRPQGACPRQDSGHGPICNVPTADRCYRQSRPRKVLSRSQRWRKRQGFRH